MTMHLLPAYYTMNKSSSKKKSSSSKPSAHDLWLAKNGLLPEQIKRKKTVDKNWKKEYTDTLKVDREGYVSAGMSGDASSCIDKTLMTNLYKEPEHVRRAVLEKASRVMPLFNKGGLQYATPETDMTTVGSKSRRG